MEMLRELRLQRGLSQRQLSARAGVDQAAISEIEAGKRSPSIAILERLAHGMDAELADLFPKVQAPLPFDEPQARRETGDAPLTTFVSRLEALAEQGERLRVEILSSPDGFPLWEAGLFAGAYAEQGSLYEDLKKAGTDTEPAREAMERLDNVAKKLKPLFRKEIDGHLDGNFRELDAS